MNYRTDSKYNDAVVEYSPSTTTVIAENPSCPSLLKKIAESCDEDGALCICNNSSVTKDILDILSVQFADDDMIVENIENALNQM